MVGSARLKKELPPSLGYSFWSVFAHPLSAEIYCVEFPFTGPKGLQFVSPGCSQLLLDLGKQRLAKARVSGRSSQSPRSDPNVTALHFRQIEGATPEGWFPEAKREPVGGLIQ